MNMKGIVFNIMWNYSCKGRFFNLQVFFMGITTGYGKLLQKRKVL